MPNPTFPSLSRGEDSSLYSVQLEDVSMSTQMDGGYVVSRAKHTRAPRRTFTSGFTNIQDADKQLLEAFYEQVRGGSVIFDWTDPSVSGTPKVYSVRFKGEMKFDYRGKGAARFWDVRFSLEQA